MNHIDQGKNIDNQYNCTVKKQRVFFNIPFKNPSAKNKIRLIAAFFSMTPTQLIRNILEEIMELDGYDSEKEPLLPRVLNYIQKQKH